MWREGVREIAENSTEKKSREMVYEHDLPVWGRALSLRFVFPSRAM